MTPAAIRAPSRKRKSFWRSPGRRAGSGMFEWHVQAGTVRLSPNFLSLYGLSDFDGRYESWLECIFREDVPRCSI